MTVNKSQSPKRVGSTVAIILGLLLVTALGASAQNPEDTVSSLPGVEITTSVDMAEMYVGDLVTYSITITRDPAIIMTPPPLGANLGAFDVKDYDSDVETKLDDGRLQTKSTFKLSTFTTGDYTIPPIPVAFMLPDSTRKVMLSESVPITVLSLLEQGGADLKLRPMKPPFAFKRSFYQTYRWYLLAAGILLIAGLILLWIRRRGADEEDVVDTRAPWEIAFEKLAVLREAGYLQNEQHKAYYFELTEVAREYLGRMYEVDSLEMTTEEFAETFAEINLPDGSHDNVLAFLRHADLVKFARMIPQQNRSEDDFLFVHATVDSVRADVEQRREAEMHVNQTDRPAPAAVEGGER